ncbi:transposase [Serratia nevei]|uniref:transposase n=1 Tax=Serratia nevei TaxID=2703794 RepID=UPI0036BEC32B
MLCTLHTYCHQLNQHPHIHVPVTVSTSGTALGINATIFDRFLPFLMSAIHQPG